jgi:peptidoglycan/LPS O-acetylase OafA/YrhL
MLTLPLIIFYSNEEVTYPMVSLVLLSLQNNKVLKNKFLVHIGKRSYCIYLFHYIAIVQLKLNFGLQNDFILTSVTLACTLLIAEATARTIEKVKIFKLT